jgi:phage terminase large subunit GpA-like protein
MTYSDKLKSPKWQKKRLQVMKRDKFRCKMCGDENTTLNVHHLKYSNDPVDTELVDLITVCEHCHELIESSKKNKENIIAVYKSNNWKNGSRIMFYTTDKGVFSLEIFDGNSKYITGFNFKEDDLIPIYKFIGRYIKSCKDKTLS